MFEMVMAARRGDPFGYKDAIDLDRLRHNPLMKSVRLKMRQQEILYIDDRFCAAHGGRQLAFWYAS
jgi:hypothetical protein